MDQNTVLTDKIGRKPTVGNFQQLAETSLSCSFFVIDPTHKTFEAPGNTIDE